MTETISFDDLKEEIGFQRNQRCVLNKDDMIIIICGAEGSGKSILALALCMIDPNFKASHIYYFWKDYLEANMNTIKKLASQLSPQDLEKYNAYGITTENITICTGQSHDPGDCLLYDESGTQMFARQSMTKQNIQQIKLYIANRFLRLIHLLCVPKLKSLDIYIRNERARFLFFIHKENSEDMQKSTRYCYVWSKSSMTNMMKMPHWYKMFDSQRNIESLYPDFKIVLPDLLDGKYIPEEILKEYNAKKILFNLKTTIDMTTVTQKEETKDRSKDYEFLKPLPEEDCWAWSKRTHRSPSAFKTWSKLANV